MREDISRLDTSQLKRRADELRVELREIEAELWRRTAVRLVALPPGWAELSATGLVLSGDELEDYVEAVHARLDASLPVGCRPNKGYPWTEVWGPGGALGRNPRAPYPRAHRRRSRSGNSPGRARAVAVGASLPAV